MHSQRQPLPDEQEAAEEADPRRRAAMRAAAKPAHLPGAMRNRNMQPQYATAPPGTLY